MTTSRTRKSTTAKKQDDPKPGQQMMDPDADEATPQTGEDGQIDVQPHAPFTERNCWAIDVLIAEVAALYPEVTQYISERAGRGVGIAVTFEGWDSAHDVEPSLPQLLSCIQNEERVFEVLSGQPDGQEPGWVAVTMHANPVTMDIRESFNLADAYAVMVDA